QHGDKGLDHTHTWASTYWGGALFCFLADVEIRKRTHNEKGLQDALRGVLDAGGDIRQDWKLEDAVRIGDKAVGVPRLSELYKKMEHHPVEVTISESGNQLGIKRDGKAIRLHGQPPLVAIRRPISRSEQPKAQQRAAVLRRQRIVFGGRPVGISRRFDEPGLS